MNHCEFCNLSEKDKNLLLYSNEYWEVFLADRQDYIARCIIVCKEHCPDISHLNDRAWLSLKSIITYFEKMISDEFQATMFNFSCLMNDTYKNEEANPHLHFHLRPRYAKKVKIGDKVFTDKEFSHHYNNKADIQIGEKEIEIIYKRLENYINCYNLKENDYGHYI